MYLMRIISCLQQVQLKLLNNRETFVVAPITNVKMLGTENLFSLYE